MRDSSLKSIQYKRKSMSEGQQVGEGGLEKRACGNQENIIALIIKDFTFDKNESLNVYTLLYTPYSLRNLNE